VSARVLTPRELAAQLRDLGLAATAEAAVLPLLVETWAEDFVRPKRRWPAEVDCHVLGLVSGPGLATVVCAIWRRPR
jgi:hypothetical protein